MTDPAFLGVLAAGSSCCVPHVLDVLAAGAACGDVWQFCAFWSLADFAASKCRPGDNLALLAFGAVSLRLLDLGKGKWRPRGPLLACLAQFFPDNRPHLRLEPGPTRGDVATSSLLRVV